MDAKCLQNQHENGEVVWMMFLPKYYFMGTSPRQTRSSFPLKLLTRNSNEIHWGVPYDKHLDCSVKVIRVSYNGGALEYVLENVVKIWLQVSMLFIDHL